MDMKAMKLLLGAACVALAGGLMTACTQDETEGLATGKLVPMTFSAGTAQTRTELGDDGMAVNWSENDAIAIFDGSRQNKFNATNVNGSTATFSGEVTEGSQSYTAFYPYTDNGTLKFADGTITFTLPVEQTATAGSFANNLNPSWAQTTSESMQLQFENICGLLKFSMTGENAAKVKSVTLTDNDVNPLAGALTLNTADGTVSSATDGTATSIKLTVENFAESDVYYFVVPPVSGLFASGLTLTFADEAGNTYQKRGSSIATIEAGKVLNLGEIAVGQLVEAWDGTTTEAVTPEGTTYTLSKPSQWAWLAEQVSKADDSRLSTSGMVINLEADMDFGGKEIVPLGYAVNDGSSDDPKLSGFWGTLNGNGHSIRNLKVSGKYRQAGFIGQLNPGAVVRDLNIVDCDLSSEFSVIDGSVKGVGGLTCVAIDATIENVTVSGKITLTQTGGYAGGVVAALYSATLINCKNYADISTTTSCSTDNNLAGGVVGCMGEYPSDPYCKPAIMIACANYGTVTSDRGGRIGGLVGELPCFGLKKQSYMVGCFNQGKVTGPGSISAFGWNPESTLPLKAYGCYNVGTIEKSGGTGMIGFGYQTETYYLPGQGIYALDSQESNEATLVGMQDSSTNCGTVTDMNSDAVVTALNTAIDAYNAENSSAPCNYKYQKGTNYPELVNESINDGDLGGLGSTAHW